MKRSSGILLAVSSLPSPYGIGTLGKAAYEFADFLHAAGQHYWQMLPLGPTSYGDSPYQSFSTFAGNPYFIDLDILIDDGLLKKSEVAKCQWGTEPRYVDYGKIYESRFQVLALAKQRGWRRDAEQVAAFREENGRWLEDYALYMACKRHFGMKSWTEWPDTALRLRKSPEVLEQYHTKLQEDVELFIYIQFLFFRQWTALREYLHQQDIQVIGDLPIYVPMDSADVWAEPEFFQLDDQCIPTAVSGVPPDYFSEDGQLWGTPLYRWDVMQEDGFGWWIRRIDGAGKLYDVIRIDHFRGFESYWSIPADAKTAREGHWEPGPGMPLVQALRDVAADIRAATGREVTVLAEDLGESTEALRQFVKDSGFPGMRVMQFAFDGDPGNIHLPYNYDRNCAAYTGTHDNNTLLGFIWEADPTTRRRILRYCGFTGTDWNCPEAYRAVIRTLLASTAGLAVLPIQDILGFGADTRMNVPGRAEGNWCFRITRDQLAGIDRAYYRELNQLYGR